MVTCLRVQHSQVVLTNSVYIGMEVQYSMTNLSDAPATILFFFSTTCEVRVVIDFMSAGPPRRRRRPPPPPPPPAPPPDLNCKL